MNIALGWNLVTLPNDPPAPATIDFSAVDIVAASTNPFTGQQQIYDWGGAMLEASVSLPPLTHTQAQAWIAFLLRLKGTANVFQFGDPLASSPQGTAGGTPVADALSTARARQITTRGWPTSQFGPYPYVLKPGDWLQIGFRLYRNLTAQNAAYAGGLGTATLDVWPPLREAVPDGTAISVYNTKGLFRLKSNVRKWSITGSRLYGMQFEIREAL